MVDTHNVLIQSPDVLPVKDPGREDTSLYFTLPVVSSLTRTCVNESPASGS